MAFSSLSESQISYRPPTLTDNFIRNTTPIEAPFSLQLLTNPSVTALNLFLPHLLIERDHITTSNKVLGCYQHCLVVCKWHCFEHIRFQSVLQMSVSLQGWEWYSSEEGKVVEHLLNSHNRSHRGKGNIIHAIIVVIFTCCYCSLWPSWIPK